MNSVHSQSALISMSFWVEKLVYRTSKKITSIYDSRSAFLLNEKVLSTSGIKSEALALKFKNFPQTQEKPACFLESVSISMDEKGREGSFLEPG